MRSNIKSTWLAAAAVIAAISASPIAIASPVELVERAAATNYLFTLYVSRRFPGEVQQGSTTTDTDSLW